MELNSTVQDKLEAIKSHKDPLSQAQMLVDLKKSSDIPNNVIAMHLGMKPSNISHLIRVTKLPDIVLDGYMSKQISFTHLILISRLKKSEEIEALYEEILKKNLTALATERRIREILYLVDHFGNYINKDNIRLYEEKMQNSLHTKSKVTISQTRIKAKVTIEMPGNLATTTEFIESFASRFRAKRKGVDEVSTSEHEVTGEKTFSNLPNVMTGAGRSQVVAETPTSQNDPRYRFDPDF